MDERASWYGADSIVPDEYASAVVSTYIDQILRPSPTSSAIGFKEIRYGGTEFPKVNEAIEYLGFLKQFFPRPKFIFNERCIDDVAKSGWWAKNKNSVSNIKDILERMNAMYNAYESDSFWISYDDYKDNPSALSPLFDFLGEDFDIEKVSSVMESKHSF